MDLFFKCRECGHKTHQRRPDGDVICMNCKITSPTIHDFVIVRNKETAGGGGVRPGRIILVDRGPTRAGEQRWVTAWQAKNDGKWSEEWLWGHYFYDVDHAEADYKSRAARGY